MKKVFQKRIKSLAGNFSGRKNSGFTLIETLVAVTILMIAVVAPLSIVAGALQSSYYARDQITAVYLAQDAMEFVKNKRDSNALKNIKESLSDTPNFVLWLADLEECIPGPCKIDTAEDAAGIITSDDSSAPEKLKYDKTRFTYGYDTNDTETRFSRTIEMEQIASDEVQVTVTVGWTGSGTYGDGKRFVLKENIYNVWKQE